MAPRKKPQQEQENPTQEQSNDAPVGVSWDVVEGTNQEYIDIYPRIQWMHGSKALNKLGDDISHLGGLFIPEDQFPNFEAEGWLHQTMTLGEENKEISGHWAKAGLLSVVRTKKFWFGGTSHYHMLVRVRGIDGIFALQTKGISKSVPMEQAFNDHRRLIVGYANQSRPQGTNPIEPFGLYFVVVPDKHTMIRSKNKPDAASEATLPLLFVPKTIDQEYISRIYVGRENYLKLVEDYRQTEAWQSQVPKDDASSPQNESRQRSFNSNKDDTPEFTGGQPVDEGDGPTFQPTGGKKNSDDIPF